MLVLTRKEDESIIIGSDIRVMVIQVQGKYVRLGIEAPKNVKILREEVHDKEPDDIEQGA